MRPSDGCCATPAVHGPLDAARGRLLSSGLLPATAGRPLIIRVLTAHIAAPNVAEANGLMRQLLADLRAQRGLAYAKLARRLVDNDDEELVLIEEWLTPADLVEWTGGFLQEARLPATAPALFEDLVITPYESLDRLPEDLDLEVLGPDADAQLAPDAFRADSA